ncbi:MAG: VOC family protein [Bacteroidota bacterium]
MKDHSKDHSPALVPMLYMKNLASAIDFYKKAFGAVERWRIDNEDGSTHVAEMTIPPILFRLHEEVSRDAQVSPATVRATTTVIGLLVNNPDELAASAVKAGATELSPMKDYEYGFRQGTYRDPFGHHWCLEKLGDINKTPKGIANEGS